MSYWQGKNAIVTGAGSGLGRALAEGLAARGVSLWLSDIDRAAAEETASLIDGVEASTATLDVRSADAFRALVNQVIQSDGHVDLLFNNAGIGMGGETHELGAEHFDRAIDVNIRGVTNGIAAAYPHMVARGQGAIVNTASASGLLPLPLFAPYAMTKHAIVGLSRSLRIEAARHGVRVCVLCPAQLKTEMAAKQNPAGVADVWRPDVKQYLARLGSRPYSVKKFVDDALTGIERDVEIVMAPSRSRLSALLYRIMPGLVTSRLARAMTDELETRPSSTE